MNETDQMNPSGQSRSARLFIMIMPNMDRVDVLFLYRQMLLIRRFEEKSAEMYALAKIAGFLQGPAHRIGSDDAAEIPDRVDGSDAGGGA